MLGADVLMAASVDDLFHGRRFGAERKTPSNPARLLVCCQLATRESIGRVGIGSASDPRRSAYGAGGTAYRRS
ncbi:hypothetical protein JCM9743_01610 [Natrinema sp. JCM 9743]